MARLETPLTGPPRRRALASQLRKMRALAGVTYAEMAGHHTGIPQATLKRAASDRGGVPKWPVVWAYRDACIDLSNDDWDVIVHGANLLDLWVKARMEERGTLRLKAPRPQYVADRADLSQALHALYEHQGAPPLRYLQHRAGGAVHLPLSTAARIVNRQALPADVRQFMAFLRGCGVEDKHEQAWRDAWFKARRSKTIIDMSKETLKDEIRRIAREAVEQATITLEGLQEERERERVA
ncbi:hypothetical protein OG416_38845 [Streptomyces longwoodensis]|uniref:hypothetical protein n=1 Tax=Streptomyces longwoodensis TaxID=68231 RepID=UPI0030E30A83|nr:hypothetical protein OG416_38845 [Streptomyces longwoodensis]